jgi:hypothetical protein
MLFLSLIGKFEQPNHVIMAFESFSFVGKITNFLPDLYADICRLVQFSGPELKLMTVRKCQNSRLLGAARNLKFLHKTPHYMSKTMEYDITDSQ